MQSILAYLENVLANYWVQSKYQVLLYIAIIVILLMEKESWKKITFGWYGIVCFVGLLNPITVKITLKVWGESVAYYCRQMSLIPIFLIIAYGTILIIEKLKDDKKVITICCIVLFFVINGYQIYSAEWYTRMATFEKISYDVIEIADFLDKQDEQIKVAVSTRIGTYMRQYANVIQSQGRVELDSVFERELESENPDVETLMKYAGERGYDFLIAKKSVSAEKKYEECGYKSDFETGNFLVYQVKGGEHWRCIYNDLNQVEKVMFVDENGKIICGSGGYAVKKYTYNKQGDVLSEQYYGEDGNPVAVDLGQFATLYEYNYREKTTKIIYCDQDNQPMRVKMGYAMIEYVYDSAGNIIREKYYDEKGNGTKLQIGQAGEVREYDEYDKIIKRTFIDENNNEVQSTLGYSRIEYIYDAYGKVACEKHYDICGDEIESK